MHDILLPQSRITRLRNAMRLSDQAALAARVPVLRRRVPMAWYFRRQSPRPAFTRPNWWDGRLPGSARPAVESALGMTGAWWRDETPESRLNAKRMQDWLNFEPAARLRDLPARVQEPLESAVSSVTKRRGLLDSTMSSLRNRARHARHDATARVHVRRAVRNLRKYQRHLEREHAGAHERLERTLNAISEREEWLRAALDAKTEHKHGLVTRMLPERVVHAPERVRSFQWSRVFVPLAVLAGTVVATYYFDRQSGRRRRALVRDQFAHAGHVITDKVPHRVAQRGRFFSGVAKGVGHGALHIVGRNGDRANDNDTLVARVRSEVLRSAQISAGEIHLEAYDGCVTLRGQLESESEIRRLISATRRVDGVREVRSYLHLPDELPPNKAALYEYAEQHLPSV